MFFVGYPMFPLFRRPGTILVLDDDLEYLVAVRARAPQEWNLVTFSDPEEFVDFLGDDAPFFDADTWLQQEIVANMRRRGDALAAQILQYWTRQTERFGLSRACVVGQSFAGEGTSSVLGALHDWHGWRGLVADQHETGLGVRAFNERLIDAYLPKYGPDAIDQLLAALTQVMNDEYPRTSNTWRSTLSLEQLASLRGTDTDAALQACVQHLNLVEHVVIGDPFGVVGLSAQGFPMFLSLDAAVGVADVENALGLDIRRSSQRLAPTVPIGIAVTSYDIVSGVESNPGYAAWLAQQPRFEPATAPAG